MRNNPMALGIANGIAAGALWGVVFLAPAVLQSFNALQLSAGRYLVYGLIAVALLLPRWRRLAPRLGRAEWFGLLWLSLAGNLVYFLLLATAVQWAGGAAASLIVGLIPVVVTLVGVREQGAVPLKQLLPALGLCVLGVALVGWESLMSEHLATPWRQRVIGLLCAFGALFSWALYSIGNSRWLARRPDLSSHDWSLLTGVTTVAWRCCWCRWPSSALATTRRRSGVASGRSAPAWQWWPRSSATRSGTVPAACCH